MPLPSAPQTLAALQAMQSLIINECLVSAASPFAALSAADQARYGVSRAVFVGRPKDFADVYLPQCCIFVPEGDAAGQPVELVGYAGRVMETVSALVQVFVDLRTDWWLGEQKILQIRDALWPVVLKHAQLGGTVPAVTEAWGEEAAGLCYEHVAGQVYRCYELRWSFTQQYVISGGRGV